MILSAFLLASCGSIRLSDHEWCGQLPDGSASCFHTFSEEERDIPREEWDALRLSEGMICGRPDAYAEFKAALLKLCRISRRCSYADREAIRRFGEHVASIKAKVVIDAESEEQ